jgi:hypothetical protein
VGCVCVWGGGGETVTRVQFMRHIQADATLQQPQSNATVLSGYFTMMRVDR